MTFKKGDRVRFTHAASDRRYENAVPHTTDGEFLAMATDKYAIVKFGNKVKRVLKDKLTKLEET